MQLFSIRFSHTKLILMNSSLIVLRPLLFLFYEGFLVNFGHIIEKTVGET